MFSWRQNSIRRTWCEYRKQRCLLKLGVSASNSLECRPMFHFWHTALWLELVFLLFIRSCRKATFVFYCQSLAKLISFVRTFLHSNESYSLVKTWKLKTLLIVTMFPWERKRKTLTDTNEDLLNKASHNCATNIRNYRK